MGFLWGLRDKIFNSVAVLGKKKTEKLIKDILKQL